jgi:hypothetical protein
MSKTAFRWLVRAKVVPKSKRSGCNLITPINKHSSDWCVVSPHRSTGPRSRSARARCARTPAGSSKFFRLQARKPCEYLSPRGTKIATIDLQEERHTPEARQADDGAIYYNIAKSIDTNSVHIVLLFLAGNRELMIALVLFLPVPL